MLINNKFQGGLALVTTKKRAGYIYISNLCLRFHITKEASRLSELKLGITLTKNERDQNFIKQTYRNYFLVPL